MAKVLGRSFFFAVLLAVAPPARAVDPVLMFLFSVAREMAGSSAAAPAPAQPPSLPPSTVYPGTTVEPAILKRLIDDSFLYLTTEQRDEIFAALHAELMKPGNFAVRAPMIEHFAQHALHVRAAQFRLAGLSSGEKQLLADQLRQEVKSMPEEEVGKLRLVLEKRLLPVPADLNRLLLAALD